LPPDLTF